jgi:hypothetical protein
MHAAHAAELRKTQRWPHDPDAPCLVPPIAQSAARGQGDPIVRELIFTLERLYYRRGALRNELISDFGDMLFPAFPELLLRPPKKRKKSVETPAAESAPPPPKPDFDRRRSDRMEATVRVLIVLACCCDWTNMEIKDPIGGYLSVWRLAELADLPSRLVAPEWDDDEGSTRRRQDRVERILQALRLARIVVYTQQHREQLDDGRYTTTAPAVRKLSIYFFRKFGGALLKTFDWRRTKLKRGKQDAQQKAFTKGVGVDLRTAEELRKLSIAGALPTEERAQKPESRTREESADQVSRRRTQKTATLRTPEPLIDQVHEENPDWSFPEVLAEARKRFVERGPPTRSSRELPKPD